MRILRLFLSNQKIYKNRLTYKIRCFKIFRQKSYQESRNLLVCIIQAVRYKLEEDFATRSGYYIIISHMYKINKLRGIVSFCKTPLNSFKRRQCAYICIFGKD